eukprot:3606209-Amphidinium_carterae.1
MPNSGSRVKSTLINRSSECHAQIAMHAFNPPSLELPVWAAGPQQHQQVMPQHWHCYWTKHMS